MTTQNDTTVDGLIINRLNKTQFNNASALAPDEIYAVSTDFTGGKVLVSTVDGDIEESTINTANVITDVTVDGTSVVTSGVANIPDAVVFRDWD